MASARGKARFSEWNLTESCGHFDISLPPHPHPAPDTVLGLQESKHGGRTISAEIRMANRHPSIPSPVSRFPMYVNEGKWPEMLVHWWWLMFFFNYKEWICIIWYFGVITGFVSATDAKWVENVFPTSIRFVCLDRVRDSESVPVSAADVASSTKHALLTYLVSSDFQLRPLLLRRHGHKLDLLAVIQCACIDLLQRRRIRQSQVNRRTVHVEHCVDGTGRILGDADRPD